MEFFAEPWYKEFFGPLTRKYEVGHCESSLIFIPYSPLVPLKLEKMKGAL